MRHLFFVAIALLLSALPVPAQTDEQATAIRSLRAELAGTGTAADSIRILYDIFDLSQRRDLPAVGRELYNTARRAGDIETCLDICRLLAGSIRDDRQLGMIEDEIRRLPDSETKRESELFVKMRRVSIKSRDLPEDERQKEITRIISSYDQKRRVPDKFSRMLDLFTLTEYLRNDAASGEMVWSYLPRLTSLARSADYKLYAIPNMVFSEAANIYADAGHHKEAVAADRKLLEIIDSLEKTYAEKGRKYRRYNISRYVAYRRMLRNYEALRPGEAEKLYRQCLELAKTDTDVKQDIDENPRLHAFYYTAIGDYHTAIPYLKQLLEREHSLGLRRIVLEMLLKASESTGDNETRLLALTEYNEILEELTRLNSANKYKELQIKFDLMDLRDRNSTLELAKRNEEITSERRMMTFVTVAFLLVGVIMVVMLLNWTRFKHNCHRMGEVVDKLAEERNRLRRSVYHDYANGAEIDDDTNWRTRLKEGNRKLSEVSTFMTESVVNDLIYISFVGKNDRIKYISKVSANSLMLESAAKAGEVVGSPARLISVRELEKDLSIITDRECLTDLLAHVLEVASSAEQGPDEIQLSCEETGKGMVRFRLTTTGPNETLSDPRKLLRTLVSTADILENRKNGLYTCRMIALLLTCDLKQDPTWTEGCSFMLTMPDNITCSIG